MYFLGWLTLGGAEIWNVERTRTYLRANAPSLEVMSCDDCQTMAEALGDPPYKNNPVDDNAPWVSADEPDLADFYGFYPMTMSGLYDSSLTATVTELSGDGGFISLPRKTSKEIRITGVLLAQTRIALTKGRAWLIDILGQSTKCGGGAGCNGATMCFFAACPTDYAQGSYYLRTVRDVAVIQGPTITQTYGQLPSGVFMDTIEFALVAATPHIYGPMDHLVTTLGTASSTTGVLTLDETAPILPDCPYVPQASVYDPLQPPLVTPPRPPSIMSAYRPPQPYSTGYSLFIPKSHVPEALDNVLIIRLRTSAEAVRYVRMRLYVNPLGFSQKVQDLDPCSFCGDITVTYIPPKSTFVIDGMNQTLTIEDEVGNVYPAGHLAFSGRGSPSVWAMLTCGVDYWLSVEFPGEGLSPKNMFIDRFTGSDSSSFESNLGHWSNGPVVDASVKASVTWSTAQPHAGTHSMKVNWPLGSTDRPQVNILDLIPGHTYALGAWVYSPNTRVRLDLGTTGGVQSVLTPGWQHITTTVVAAATQHMARVTNTTTSASGDVWFDDFTLYDVTSAPNTLLEVDIDASRRE